MLKRIIFWFLIFSSTIGVSFSETPTPEYKPTFKNHLEKTHVRRGENLLDVARRCRTTTANLIHHNNLKPPYIIYINQPLLYEKKPLVKPALKLEVKTSQVVAKIETSIDIPLPLNKPSLKIKENNKKDKSSAKKLTRSGKYFAWPVEGKVISKFGKKKLGLTNDGINIAATYHSPIRATENGIVVYAGNEIKGFGNLILLKHAEGWASAYAHNDILLVEKGQYVSKGDIIAKAGNTGNVKNTQLHFELRKKAKPVDPIKYLKK